MELVGRPDVEFWRGKRVLLTGHTGFKGSWLGCWLTRLGAEVHGFALPPETTPDLHGLLDVGYESETIADLRDRAAVEDAVSRVNPEIVFHLAAQPLVRRAYREPVETMATNIMGTVHLLNALRMVDGLKAALIVTSDKAYDNDAYDQAKGDLVFTEDDPLGGRDPYSASKGAQEIVTRSFAQSYFAPAGIAVATARAGNVVGGGDWSEDRLMTDVIAALSSGRKIGLRNPDATRPWQHVLEPLGGYLTYMEALVAGKVSDRALNFGPDRSDSVSSVVELADRAWRDTTEVSVGGGWIQDGEPGPKEARTLALSSERAKEALGWRPRLGLEECILWVVDWHKAHVAGDDMRQITAAQISRYEEMMDQK